MRSAIAWLCGLGLVAAGCGTGGQSGEPFTEARSALKREQQPNVSADAAMQLADGNRAFAVDMYQALVAGEPDDAVFFSPYSISIALAMTYAGSLGATSEAMASTLHFQLEEPALHEAFNSVDLALASRGQEAKGKDDEPFRLNISNTIWGQQGAMFLEPFLDTLAVNYGAGIKLLDFIEQPEESRVIINEWVAEQTEERIKELLPEMALDRRTRLVLVNTIYFNASWLSQFEKRSTAPGDFTTLAGEVKSVPMMHGGAARHYAGEGVQAVERPYDGGELAMVLIVPDAGQFSAFEAAMTADSLHAILTGLETKAGVLAMPKWKYEGASIALKNMLSDLGMGLAFSGEADFGRMLTTEPLHIANVHHKAFIEVDETGTEAAAATAVVVSMTTSVPPPPAFDLTIDRPFIYLIRDTATDTILFLGRVVDPS